MTYDESEQKAFAIIERIAAALERQCQQHDEAIARNLKWRDENIERHQRERDEELAESKRVNNELLAQIDEALRLNAEFKRAWQDAQPQPVAAKG